MKNLKKLLCLLLAVIMLIAMSTTAFAAVGDTGFSDVAQGAWYADAVTYVRDNNLMSGTSDTAFSPNANTSRAMLAVILYRASGSPEASSSAGFTDAADGAWYTDAVNWAARLRCRPRWNRLWDGCGRPASPWPRAACFTWSF